MDLREAARALMAEVDRMFQRGEHGILFEPEFRALRTALEEAQPETEAPAGGCPDCDAKHPRYAVPSRGEVIHVLPGGQVSLCEKAHPTPAATGAREAWAERSVVEAAVRAMRETALVHYNTPQEYDVACAQRAACEMASLNALDAYLAHRAGRPA